VKKQMTIDPGFAQIQNMPYEQAKRETPIQEA